MPDAAQHDLAARRPARAVEPLQERGAARAEQPEHADDFAGVDIEVDRAGAAHGKVAQTKQFGAGAAGRCLAPHAAAAGGDRRGDAGDVECGDRVRHHHLAIAQHRHMIGDAEQLRQMMRDIDHRDPARGELADLRAEPGDIGLPERRGGLVEDQHARPVPQRLDDLDKLLLADRQVSDRRCRVDPYVELRQQLARDGVLPCPVDHAAAAQFAPEKHVVGHREHVDHAQMLIDHRDAGGEGFERRKAAVMPAGDDDVAAVRLVCAAKAADQRRLAGAVGPEQRMHRARLDREVDAFQDVDAAEAFA